MDLFLTGSVEALTIPKFKERLKQQTCASPQLWTSEYKVKVLAVWVSGEAVFRQPSSGFTRLLLCVCPVEGEIRGKWKDQVCPLEVLPPAILSARGSPFLISCNFY